MGRYTNLHSFSFTFKQCATSLKGCLLRLHITADDNARDWLMTYAHEAYRGKHLSLRHQQQGMVVPRVTEATCCQTYWMSICVQ